ncbi:CaiB/BaiF CoA transferase family protein [Saccharopolyspora shandongensis]|uniref:CaiB/BaiF CoA transferase family protein n=1 Tax=Saccharopolyspora shandongensis TaxID=418495 RepID=UPI0033CB98AB
MLLADLGAEVVRIERHATAEVIPWATGDSDQLLRGREIRYTDLKNPADVAGVLELVETADVLVEGFRPGVAERLGLGPEECRARNPRLVYGRMTGWGQTGPLAQSAGHDLNYIALTGVLDNIGRAGERPVPPLNLVGDFGGGSMFLVTGILAALWERVHSGVGQVVDAAIVDGTGVLAQMQWSLRGSGAWSSGRGVNVLDGSAPFYDTYVCADGRYVAVGCIEPQFFAAMLRGLGLDPAELPRQWERDRWDELRDALKAAFASRERDAWDKIFGGSDACVTPGAHLRGGAAASAPPRAGRLREHRRRRPAGVGAAFLSHARRYPACAAAGLTPVFSSREQVDEALQPDPYGHPASLSARQSPHPVVANEEFAAWLTEQKSMLFGPPCG